MNSKMEIMLKNEKIPKTSVAKILKIQNDICIKKLKKIIFSIQDLVKLEQVFGKSSLLNFFMRLTGQEEKWGKLQKQNIQWWKFRRFFKNDRKIRKTIIVKYFLRLREW